MCLKCKWLGRPTHAFLTGGLGSSAHLTHLTHTSDLCVLTLGSLAYPAHEGTLLGHVAPSTIFLLVADGLRLPTVVLVTGRAVHCTEKRHLLFTSSHTEFQLKGRANFDKKQTKLSNCPDILGREGAWFQEPTPRQLFVGESFQEIKHAAFGVIFVSGGRGGPVRSEADL